MGNFFAKLFGWFKSDRKKKLPSPTDSKKEKSPAYSSSVETSVDKSSEPIPSTTRPELHKNNLESKTDSVTISIGSSSGPRINTDNVGDVDSSKVPTTTEESFTDKQNENKDKISQHEDTNSDKSVENVKDHGEESTNNAERSNLVMNITEELVRTALSNDLGHEAHLRCYTVKDFTKPGDNYASKVTSVVCTYELCGKVSEVVYVVKVIIPFGLDESSEMTCELFEREGKFLTETADKLNDILFELGESKLKIPKCVLNSFDSVKSAIFMKDLRKEDYKLFDRKIGMAPSHATMVLEELARLHALGFIVRNRYKKDLLDVFPFMTDKWLTEECSSYEGVRSLMSQIFKETLRLIEDNEKNKIALQFLVNVVDNPLEFWKECVSLGDEKFRTICHGDIWNNNIMFRYSEQNTPKEVVLFDLQLCRVASLSTDLNYFLMLSTEVEVRGQNLTYFLETYYEEFKAILKKGKTKVPFSFSELKEEYFRLNIYGFHIAQMGMPLIMKESSAAPDFSGVTAENMETFMEKQRTINDNLIKENPMFHSRYLGVMDDCIKSGAFKAFFDKKAERDSKQKLPKHLGEFKENDDRKKRPESNSTEQLKVPNQGADDQDQDPTRAITHELVKNAVRVDLGEEVTLDSFEVKDFTKPGDGYACKVTGVECVCYRNEDKLKIKYVVKVKMPFVMVGYQEMLEEMFQKEGYFLTKVVSETDAAFLKIDEPPLKVPKCVLNHISGENSAIFMKDLREINFKMLNDRTGMDKSHTILILKELARLHAVGYILKENGKDLWSMFPQLIERWIRKDSSTRSSTNNTLSQSLKGSIHMLETQDNYSLPIECIKEMLSDPGKIWEESVTNSPKQFETLCHGDVWSNNFLFRYSDDNQPQDVILLDLQLARIASVSTDLNYFLLGSTHGEMRKENLDELLQVYYNKFQSILRKGSIKSPFTFEELKEEYVRLNLFGFLVSQFVIPLLMREDSEPFDFAKLSEENMEDYFENENAKTEDMMVHDPLFKSRYMATIDECVESGAFEAFAERFQISVSDS